MKRATDAGPIRDRGRDRIEPQLCFREAIQTLLSGPHPGGAGLDLLLDRIERMP